MNARSDVRFVPPLLAVAGALAAAGCNRGEETGKGEPAPVANSAQQRPQLPPPEKRRPAQVARDDVNAAAVEAAPAKPGDVTRGWFAGSWTDSGDCADAGRFAPNGTYLLADGTRGMWSVQDNRLVVQHAGGRNTLRLRRVDQATVEIVNEDGSVGRSTRCG